MLFDLQFFGGRGGGSSRGKSGGGGGGATTKATKSNGSGKVPRSVRESSDWDTVVTQSGKTTIVELGESDMRNPSIRKSLQKAGFTQRSDFRWTYEDE